MKNNEYSNTVLFIIQNHFYKNNNVKVNFPQSWIMHKQSQVCEFSKSQEDHINMYHLEQDLWSSLLFFFVTVNLLLPGTLSIGKNEPEKHVMFIWY